MDYFKLNMVSHKNYLVLKGFELNAVSRTTKPRCKVHWVRSEPCLSNPSAPGQNLPVRTVAQSVRRPGIEPRISIVTLAGFAAKYYLVLDVSK